MVILGASFDSVEDNAAFAAKFGFPFRLLSDPDRAMGLDYGAAQTSGDGYAKRISFLIGPDGRIEKCYPKVFPASHPDEVLADVRRIVGQAKA